MKFYVLDLEAGETYGPGTIEEANATLKKMVEAEEDLEHKGDYILADDSKHNWDEVLTGSLEDAIDPIFQQLQKLNVK